MKLFNYITKTVWILSLVCLPTNATSNYVKGDKIVKAKQIYIFANMKSFLKIIIFLLISCSYINTVFEFSDNEKKLNFENEAHSYIQQDVQNLQNVYKEIVSDADIVIISEQSEIIYPVTAFVNEDSYNISHSFTPPKKRYILYSSLII